MVLWAKGSWTQPIRTMEQSLGIRIAMNKEISEENSRDHLLLKRASFTQGGVTGKRFIVYENGGLPRGRQRGVPHMENAPSRSTLFQVRSNTWQKYAESPKCCVCVECKMFSMISPSTQFMNGLDRWSLNPHRAHWFSSGPQIKVEIFSLSLFRWME